MQEQFVKVEAIEGGIVSVTIDRQEALNALNNDVLVSLQRVFRGLRDDHSIRVVILTGAGKSFVAGADIKEMMGLPPSEATEFCLKGQAVLAAIEEFPRPVIAAVNGFALGGGCELAMACDFRIASDKAKFGQPEVNLGIIPGFGGTQRLPRFVGRAHAKMLLFTGEVIRAEKALQIGLVQEVVPPENLMPRCIEIARMICAKAPIAVSLCKRAVNRGIEVDLSQGLQGEAEIFGETFGTWDQKEGMNAFLLKRAPEFQNK